MRRVIVCGGRRYGLTPDTRRVVCGAIAELGEGGAHYVVVHGDQEGADKTAAYFAERFGHLTEPHPPDLERYGSPVAYHVRNRDMVDRGAEFVLAFPGGVGTEALKVRAMRAGIPIVRRG